LDPILNVKFENTDIAEVQELNPKAAFFAEKNVLTPSPFLFVFLFQAVSHFHFRSLSSFFFTDSLSLSLIFFSQVVSHFHSLSL